VSDGSPRPTCASTGDKTPADADDGDAGDFSRTYMGLDGSALIESRAMGTIRGSVRDVMDLFRSSRSYRLVAAIVTALTLVPLAIGLIEGFRVGGSALGYVIGFVVSVGFSGVWLGIVLWALAMIWYRPKTH
jgi:hypothetical protein